MADLKQLLAGSRRSRSFLEHFNGDVVAVNVIVRLPVALQTHKQHTHITHSVYN